MSIKCDLFFSSVNSYMLAALFFLTIHISKYIDWNQYFLSVHHVKFICKYVILCWIPLSYSEKRAEQSIFQYTHAHEKKKKKYRSKSPICFAVRGFVVCYLECLDYYEIFVCFGISFGSHQKSNANEISTPNINKMVR